MTLKEQLDELEHINMVINSTWLKDYLELSIRHVEAQPYVNVREHYRGDLFTRPYAAEQTYETWWSINPVIWRTQSLSSKVRTLIECAMKSPALMNPVVRAMSLAIRTRA